MAEPTKSDARATVQAFLTRRRAALARLRRVNRALAQWDELEAAAALPAALRPVVMPPKLGRRALRELRAMLADELLLMEAAWEQRN